MTIQSSKKNKNIIVLGGGIPGIFSALYLSKIYKNHEIYLIESNQYIGGLYNSFHDQVSGTFDKGMHIIYETGDIEIDSIIRGALNDNEWIFLEGNYKDIAGVYYKGHLKTESPYLSIDQISEDNYDNCIRDLFNVLKDLPPELGNCRNAQEFYVKRFGNSLSKELFEPVLKKLWRINPEKLHPAITRIILMDRLITFEEESLVDLMKAERIRSRIAFPNQMNLDLSYRNNQKGLYPKSFGMSNVIDGLEKQLKNSNIHICKNTKLKNIHHKNNSIKSVTINSNLKDITIDGIEILHSTISPLQLLKFFNKKVNSLEYDKPLTQRYVYLLLNEPPNMSNLYYFYSFESGMKTYRVTNYGAYCPSAIRDKNSNFQNTWPICIELHYDDPEPNNKKVIEESIKELLITGVIKDENTIVFSNVEKAAGVPLLSTKNCNIASDSYKIIKDLKIKNLLLGCQMPEKGIFFLHDVLLHTKSIINDF